MGCSPVPEWGSYPCFSMNEEVLKVDIPNCKLYLARAREILMDILSINTCQPAGNEATLADHLIGLFPKGTDYRLLPHGENRASLIVHIPGRETGNGLAFAGHLDTVAYGDKGSWRTDPACPTVEGDRVYARGAADMKGGVVAMTAVALYFLEQGITPVHDLYFCYTADEEKGGMGAGAIAEGNILTGVSRLIIAEPTKGQISLGEKGALWLRATARGVQSHGSRPDLGVNAIELLVHFAETLKGSLDMETEHPLFGHTTAAITNLHGGVMTNIIPPEATLEMDIRTIPGQSNRDILEKACRIAEELCQANSPLKITVETLNDRPAVGVSEEDPLVLDMQAAARSLGLSDQLRGTIFYTDASQLVPHYQIPFLILGPGDDALAHQSNEYITFSSLEEITSLYLRYLEQEMG